MWNSADNAAALARSASEDEAPLRWAALARLPTYAQVRRGIFKDLRGDWREIDVSELDAEERKILLERLMINTLDHDPGRFFDRIRSRFDA